MLIVAVPHCFTGKLSYVVYYIMDLLLFFLSTYCLIKVPGVQHIETVGQYGSYSLVPGGIVIVLLVHVQSCDCTCISGRLCHVRIGISSHL